MLDVVEVADSHTGDVLSEAFVGVLAEFLITEKVSSSSTYTINGTHRHYKQLLSITTDNASSNDTMINGIAVRIPSFPGEPAHSRCLDHIMHLTGKSFLRPFDVSTAKETDNARTATEASLAELAKGLDVEESEMVAMGLEATAGSEMDEAGLRNGDNVDGRYDEVAELSREEREELDETVQPVKFALVKVSSHSQRSGVFFICTYSTFLLTLISYASYRSLLSTRLRSCCPHGTIL